ncbi:hypothetical protein [Thiobacillus denitrificans]|uniref:Uncharacterized protein n=1 Tax=Thiobacillus denitrificans TaxID=36861 RepID=A0A106BIF7_THIDE|nr:hypothetical protein [Thiobacillus denitrificans]KVW93145.1 hypothetical protein ABW22_15090 [Thiobacillus denitrificans]
MGPIALFDKSFLQSLTVDESVWFDHFFLPVVSPLFFVETLADLAKQRKDGARTPEEEVRVIADKTPVLSGAPCVHHAQLCIANLLGHEAPHLGQIPVAGGRPVRGADGKPGVVFENSPEAEAFARWQRSQFHEIEHGVASSWRAMLTQLNLPEVAHRMRALGITPQTCRTVKQAYGIAASLVHSRYEPEQQIGLLFSFVQVPQHLQAAIIYRWSQAGFPPLAGYASYAAHVLMVEIFFQIALAANLISSERPSNRVDIAYLFYLPFCHIFVSGDKLHKLCAPEFLQKEQDFVWAPELKGDLARINRELMATSELERQMGLHKLAPRPPGNTSHLTVALWQKHAPGSGEADVDMTPMSPEAERKLIDHLKSFTKAPTDPEVAGIPSDELQSISIERLVPARKGSWWLIPKKVADAEGREDA